MTHQLISPEKLSVVNLTTDEHQVRLVLRLAHEFTGGDLVQFAPDATVSVEGADPLSATYTRANWASGMVSGALYAFRTLRIPRQYLVVHELTGRLRASDMDAVANGSAAAIAKLAGQELLGLALDGWIVQVELAERPTTGAARMNADLNGSLSQAQNSGTPV